MAAYLIALVDITDPGGMEEYRAQAGPIVAQHGGRFLAAGEPDVREGESRPHVAVVIEFPDMERARAWYDAADYRDAKALRQRSARTTLLFVDGLPAQ